MLCCREAIPLMRRHDYGKIIVISGGGATRPLPRFSAYAASKAAVVRFAETLAYELRGSGIDVNSIAPGALNTQMLDEVLEAGPERAGQSFYDKAVEQKAKGGTPLDIAAHLVAFLASPACDGISGRLISAVWDNWQYLPQEYLQENNPDRYTLRRVS
jgi:NAD(P)-dependent dehydrogenase (short-subunit alcohol dehydrogenase family)